MRKKILLILLVFFILLIGCETNNIDEEKDNIFNFTGTWRIEFAKTLGDKNESDNSDFNYLIGEEIKIGNNRISILDSNKKGIRYKLKAVGKDYTLSYENNLTMNNFMNDRETIDLISIIDNNQIIGEFFLSSDNEMVLLYKSSLIKLNRISQNVVFNNDNNNINIGNETPDNDVNFTEGIMLGIKTPREMNDDGTYSKEGYRTLWISHDNWNIGNVYEKNNIIFPRLNGIWKLSINENSSNGFNYDEFKVSMYDEVVKDETVIKEELNKNEFKSIKFVGNDYIAIEKYEGTDFQGSYPIYQIVPVSNINIENGLQVDEIFNSNEKEKYISEYTNEINSLPKEILKGLNINNIDYNNIAIERRVGRWMFVANILPNNMNESGVDFKISILPDSRFINYNSLYISWKALKGQLGFFKDVFISPLGKIALIQFDDYIAIYKIEDTMLIAEPLVMIPIEENEEIIMSEWASGSYVEQWEKVFVDGELIIRNE